MKLTPYHEQFIQVLIEDDFGRRREFAKLMLTKFQQNPDIIRNAVWTDEVIFHTSGSDNRQLSVWRLENPNATSEYHFQPPGVMMMGDTKYEGLIGLLSGRSYHGEPN